MNENYQTPTLAVLFRGIAWLNVAGAVVLGIITLTTLMGSSSGTVSAAVGFFTFFPIVSSLIAALIFAGIGEVIDLIGQTAFNSALIADAVEKQGGLAAVWAKDTQGSLHSIVSHTRPVGLPVEPAGKLAPSVRRFYYLDPTGQPTGPATIERLKQFAADGVLHAESLVCLEGTERWTKLGSTINSD